MDHVVFKNTDTPDQRARMLNLMFSRINTARGEAMGASSAAEISALGKALSALAAKVESLASTVADLVTQLANKQDKLSKVVYTGPAIGTTIGSTGNITTTIPYANVYGVWSNSPAFSVSLYVTGTMCAIEWTRIATAGTPQATLIYQA